MNLPVNRGPQLAAPRGSDLPAIGIVSLVALACGLQAGCEPSGGFSRRHRGGLMRVRLTRCGSSALWDALPGRESTALQGEAWPTAKKYVERRGLQQRSICQGLGPPATPHLIPGARASPVFSFPLAARLSKVQSVYPNSKPCPNTQDRACSVLLVYIASRHSLLSSLTAHSVCFLVSDCLTVN